MNAARLLALYDRIVEAPDAVPRLRHFVLDLAVRGKVVEQDPADEPASELLKRIASARKLAPASGRKSKKACVDSSLVEVAFPLPAGWSSARLSELVRVLNGRAYKKAELLDSGTSVLRVGNLFTSNHWYYSDLELEEDKYCDKGDLIYAWSASFGPFIWQGPRVIYHYHIWKLPLFTEANLDKQFLYLFLLQKTQEIKGAGHGISMIHMTKEKMEQLGVPLPPLAEQHRIVAKVDELMTLCDRLEANRNAREKTRDRLTKASHARLSAPDTDAAVFRSHARFAVDALPALTARAAQVKQLRQTILNLAVRGKLVEQDPADEPASELLKRIEVERARIPNAKKRKSCPLKAEAVDGDFFDLPTGWEWGPLAGISDVTMGQSPPGKSYNKSGEGVPLINGPVDFTPGPFGRTMVNQFTTAPRKFCEEGDLLICVRASTGRTNVAAFRACIGRGVAAIRSSFDDDYVRLFLWKVREDIISIGRGIVFPNVSKKQLETLAIPLPPLAEQHRIVAKVDELMTLCDRLEAGLSAVDTGRNRLLESLLWDVLKSAANEPEAAHSSTVPMGRALLPSRNKKHLQSAR